MHGYVYRGAILSCGTRAEEGLPTLTSGMLRALLDAQARRPEMPQVPPGGTVAAT